MPTLVDRQVEAAEEAAVLRVPQVSQQEPREEDAQRGAIPPDLARRGATDPCYQPFNAYVACHEER